MRTLNTYWVFLIRLRRRHFRVLVETRYGELKLFNRNRNLPLGWILSAFSHLAPCVIRALSEYWRYYKKNVYQYSMLWDERTFYSCVNSVVGIAQRRVAKVLVTVANEKILWASYWCPDS